MREFITLDVGGTFIKFGLLNEKGEILQEGSLPTEAHLGGENVFENICHIIENLKKDSLKISGIGIGSSGVISPKGTILKSPPHFPGWAGIELGERLKEKFNLPVKVGNDVNVMALAEKYFGEAKDMDNFVFLAIGTGIGAGFFFNGKLYIGSRGAAAEVGSLRSSLDCKTYWEKEASTSSLIKKAKEKSGIDTLVGPDIFKEYKANNPIFISLVDKWVEDLAKGIADIIVMIDPQVIFLGGAISEQIEWLEPLLRENIERHVLHNLGIPLRISRLKGQVGLLGALSLFLNE